MRAGLFAHRAALALALCASPLAASAHALPEAYDPASSAVLVSAPSALSIRFSERVDVSASSIRVTGPSGAPASGKLEADPSNPRALRVPITASSTGAYRVSWSVVSADDGHFTKGAYEFAVGQGTPAPAANATSQVVEIATVPETAGMTVELLGNGIIWAALLLWLFAARPLLNEGKYEKERRALARGCGLFLLLGVTLALAGGGWQLSVKSADLAALQGIPHLAAFWLYARTAAGSATASRIALAFLTGATYFLGRARIAAAARATPHEFAMVAFMAGFAYLRAKISHATANPFHPGLSIAMNFLHLIEKDLLAGIALALLLVVLVPRLRAFADALLPRAFAMLGVDLALVSVTASYIIWLHLKSFHNLFTTAWGSALLQLALAAVLLVALRSYHVFARLGKPRLFAKLLPLTLAAEVGLGLLVVYASSVIILTSPPLTAPTAPSVTARDQGMTLTLGADPYEDGMVLLTTTAPADAPVPTLTVAAGNMQPVSLALAKRFAGGYVFPMRLLPGDGHYAFQVTAPQPGGYDAHAAFTLTMNDLMPVTAAAPDGGRTFDAFTWTMLGIALAACAYSLFLSRLSLVPAGSASLAQMPYAGMLALLSFALAASGGGTAMRALAASSWSNPFQAECVADGNEWHAMLPSIAGAATSQTPAEGCMWGMGSYMYLFPEKREYDYYRSLPPAQVTFDHPAQLAAGVPAPLTFALKNADGTPATLFIDMEKRIHIVIASKDQTVFAHIHPDDQAPLTAQAIETSAFTRSYVFPKAGTYLVAIDYAHGLTLESKQFIVDVAGAPAQAPAPAAYRSPGTFAGYAVAFDPGFPVAGQVTTMRYTITKDGRPVTDLAPYLSAAAHVSVVKDDLSAYVHVHGEVHPPGAPYPPLIIRNGQVVHSMASMALPEQFGPMVEAHLIFPSAGLYTVWAEFKIGNEVIPTSFTVDVR